MSDAIISANERRAAIQAHAAAIGIDEDYISLVVDTFYANVRAQPLLGLRGGCHPRRQSRRTASGATARQRVTHRATGICHIGIRTR